MPDKETPLFGGLVDGRVVRVGDTVRRPAGPWTETIQTLLAHLAGKAFPCPRPRGLDGEGREVVSFLPGRAGLWPWPGRLRSLEGAAEAGAFVRRLHDAVADFRPPWDAVWRHGPQPMADGEIVIHGDLGPYNMIWDDKRLTGVIDFELARPGRPVEDTAFAAVRIAALRDDAATARYGFDRPPDRRARLAAFAAGYRIDMATLAEALIPAQAGELERMERLGAAGLEPWATFVARGLPDTARGELDWMEANRGRYVP